MKHDNLTVLIPFKRGGREDWLREAVGSLPRGQRHLVLLNDGELAEALNEGLRQAGTEFVFRLDADDMVTSRTLDFLVDLAWDCDVTYPSLLLSETVLHGGLKPFEKIEATPFSEHRLLVRNNVPACAVFRPEKALAVGGYRDLEMLDDWDLWVRMMRAGCRFKPVPEAYYLYRQHPGSRNKRQTDSVYQSIVRRIVGEEPDLKATWYHQKTPATTYWRCQLPAKYLPGMVVHHPEVRNVGTEDDPVLEFPFHRGDSIWQFPGDGSSAVIMCSLQEQGHKALVEVDDNYLAPSRYFGGWVKHQRSSSSLETHRKICETVADGVIVTTEHLARMYRQVNKNVFVCPNQIDPSDWAEPVTNGNPFRIGWFASLSHKDDVPLVRRALEWASKQDGVEVVCMGVGATRVINTDENTDVHRPWWKFRFRHYPWSNDMGVYRKLMGTLDVGLAPVKENPWSSCRSDLKALEYAMANACPVLSDAIPYRGYEGPCVRATSAKDFLNQVKYLVAHQDEAKQIASEAREHVLKHRTVEGNIWRYKEALNA